MSRREQYANQADLISELGSDQDPTPTTNVLKGVIRAILNRISGLLITIQSTILGYQAGLGNTGNNVTLIGSGAGDHNTADDVTVVGPGSAYHNTGTFLTAMGFQAGASNTGDNVIAIGFRAAYENTEDRYLDIGGELTGIMGAGDVDNPPTFQNDLKVAGNLRLVSNPPETANSTGKQGTIAWDDEYLYVCTADDTWKRVAIETWS